MSYSKWYTYLTYSVYQHPMLQTAILVSIIDAIAPMLNKRQAISKYNADLVLEAPPTIQSFFMSTRIENESESSKEWQEMRICRSILPEYVFLDSTVMS